MSHMFNVKRVAQLSLSLHSRPRKMGRRGLCFASGLRRLTKRSKTSAAAFVFALLSKRLGFGRSLQSPALFPRFYFSRQSCCRVPKRVWH